MTKTDSLVLQKPLEQVGEHIGYELGAKMVKDYADATGDYTNHLVGREIIEKILAQPNCAGIRIFKALDEQNRQTYVFVGVDADGNGILEYIGVNEFGDIQKHEGIVADRNNFDNGWWDWGKETTTTTTTR